MLFEDAYEQAVPASSLPVGEYVVVTTRMGSEVDSGEVVRVFGNGAVQIRTSETPPGVPVGGIQSNGDPIYNSQLYLFVPTGEPPVVAAEDKSISEADPDQFPGADAPTSDGDPDELAGTDAEKADAKASLKIKDAGSRSDARSPKDKVDVDALPQALKQKVMGIDEMDEAQIDRVMSAISEAALKSLKDVGVADSEVYETVVQVQKAVRSKLDKPSGK